MTEKKKTPSAGKLAGMLLNCRQDLERQGQQVHNLTTRVMALAAENDALRRELGREPPPPPPSSLDLLSIRSRQRLAVYELGMERPLSDEQVAQLVADLDTVLNALVAQVL